MSQVLCVTLNIPVIQKYAFFMYSSKYNSIIRCSTLKGIDFDLWQNDDDDDDDGECEGYDCVTNVPYYSGYGGGYDSGYDGISGGSYYSYDNRTQKTNNTYSYPSNREYSNGLYASDSDIYASGSYSAYSNPYKK